MEILLEGKEKKEKILMLYEHNLFSNQENTAPVYFEVFWMLFCEKIEDIKY